MSTLKLLKSIRDDLRMRADIDHDGKNVINLSHSFWLELNQEISRLESSKRKREDITLHQLTNHT